MLLQAQVPSSYIVESIQLHPLQRCTEDVSHTSGQDEHIVLTGCIGSKLGWYKLCRLVQLVLNILGKVFYCYLHEVHQNPHMVTLIKWNSKTTFYHIVFILAVYVKFL